MISASMKAIQGVLKASDSGGYAGISPRRAI